MYFAPAVAAQTHVTLPAVQVGVSVNAAEPAVVLEPVMVMTPLLLIVADTRFVVAAGGVTP